MRKLMTKEIYCCFACIHKTVAFTCELTLPEKNLPPYGWIPEWCPLPNAPPKEANAKRTRCYIMQPYTYDISCDLCGGSNITWSEYEHMIWCYDCEKDTHGTDGIFDGPIPIQAMALLGISLDMIEIDTGERLYMRIKEDRIVWEKHDGN